MWRTACKGGWGIQTIWTLWKLPHRLLASWRMMPSSCGEATSAHWHAVVRGSWLVEDAQTPKEWKPYLRLMNFAPCFFDAHRRYSVLMEIAVLVEWLLSEESGIVAPQVHHGGCVGLYSPEAWCLKVLPSDCRQIAAACNAQTTSACGLSDGADDLVDMACSDPLLAV